jgi:hypothetical protein
MERIEGLRMLIDEMRARGEDVIQQQEMLDENLRLLSEGNAALVTKRVLRG